MCYRLICPAGVPPPVSRTSSPPAPLFWRLLRLTPTFSSPCALFFLPIANNIALLKISPTCPERSEGSLLLLLHFPITLFGISALLAILTKNTGGGSPQEIPALELPSRLGDHVPMAITGTASPVTGHASARGRFLACLSARQVTRRQPLATFYTEPRSRKVRQPTVGLSCQP